MPSGKFSDGSPATPCEEVWNQAPRRFWREVAKHFAKGGNVIVGCVIGQLHSRDHHAHVRISRFHLIDDLLKIVSNLIDRHAAKGIVDSELQNEDVDLAFQMGREPLQAAFGGAAGRAGIGHLKIQAGGAQLLCEQSRIGFARRKLKPSERLSPRTRIVFIGAAWSGRVQDEQAVNDAMQVSQRNAQRRTCNSRLASMRSMIPHWMFDVER